MKGNGRLAWMIGAMVVLGFAAPSHAAVSAGNILAAPATVDNIYSWELRVQMAATDQLHWPAELAEVVDG